MGESPLAARGLEELQAIFIDIYPLRVKPGHRNVLHAPTRYTSFEAGKH
jgi:hypothetical protein